MHQRASECLATLQPTAPPIAELDHLGDQIAELSAHLDAATARLLTLIREFDVRGGWNTGFRSCAEWLAWRVGPDLGAARERVRVARALGTLPLLADALAHGELSYAKIRALTRVATPQTEARLVAVGRTGTAAHIERIVRGWRRLDRRAEAREVARQHAGRALHVYRDDDGMVVLRGRLTAELGELFLRALDAARETLYQRRRAGAPTASDPATPPPTGPQQRADALALLAETALHHELDPGSPGERYQVVVHVDAGCWPIRTSLGSRCSMRGPTFPRKRPAGLRATRAGWSCGTTRTEGLWRSAPGRGRFHPRCGGHCTIGIGTAASPAAVSASVRDITCATGRRVARPHCQISRCFAGSITAPYTKRAIRSSYRSMARFGSEGPTAGFYPTCRRRRRCLPTRWRHYGRSTWRTGSTSMRARDLPGGWGSAWTWAGRSTCCTRSPRGPLALTGPPDAISLAFAGCATPRRSPPRRAGRGG